MLKQEYYSVHDGQTLFDVSTALYGDSSFALQLSYHNNLSLTENLFSGQKIFAIDQKSNNQVLQVYKQTESIPATGLGKEIIKTMLPTGIGHMQIENNFKVS